ncbi:MAG: flagellar hook-basal body complex protein FliE [Desulfobacterales bacterium]|nr:flagellar hook-basal body complex protein FliE [Desulfobacterales bacterium]MDJ0882589.1 flagellar hook-basal body complex protein FliE [Desulfobacterales bacterium]
MAEIDFIKGAGSLQPVPTRSSNPAKDAAPGFGNLLEQALDDVTQKHVAADQAVSDLVAGKSQDIHNVMIATQKADIGFQLLMQVRNKVVGAYETIMRMQI